MKISEHGLNDTVEEIETMIRNLEQAKSARSSIAIPADFQYANNIWSLFNEIDGIIYNLEGLIQWINDAVERFREARRKSNEIASGLNGEVSNNRYLEHRAETEEKIAASSVNFGASFLKGIASVGEYIIDALASFGLFMNELGGHNKGNMIATPDGWKSMSDFQRETTMSFVAEENVDNAFEDFYNNTNVGKYLDEKAYTPFKSDGVACEFASGLGEVAAIGGIVAATGGLAAAGGATVAAGTTAGISAGVATVSGIGKYTEEFWANLRDESWEGMEKMYEDGEISEEIFNSYMMIRAFSNEEWDEIEDNYANGVITSEQYEQMKYLREMPEKWTTKENMLKGLAYGTASGLWEGIQWYVGGKLAGFTLKSGSKIASSAVRVGVDSGFNAGDTFARAGIDSMVTGQSIDEAFLEQGGWVSVLTNLGIGLVGSIGGEVVDVAKSTKKIKTDINIDNPVKIKSDINVDNPVNSAGILNIDEKTLVFEDISQERVDEIADILMTEHNLGKINLITDSTETLNARVRDCNNKLNNGIDIKSKMVFEHYLDNIEELSAQGMSIEEFLDLYEIDLMSMNNKLSVAEILGDSKLYILETVQNTLQNGNLSKAERVKLETLLTEYSKKRPGNLKTEDMLKDFKKYLSEEQIKTAKQLQIDGVSDNLASKYDETELAAIFNYTACGGLEINAWLNDTRLPNRSKMARDEYNSISELQDAISSYPLNYDENDFNKILKSEDRDILECLDSLISSTNYNDAIVTYRGLQNLYDGNKRLDIQNLRIGDSFTSEGYQSSSVTMNDCYAIKKNGLGYDTILKIVVPPNSGTAAYIENISGVTNYGQMEMLIKRNAKMTVVGDLEFINVDGIIKTIVPVVVE